MYFSSQVAYDETIMYTRTCYDLTQPNKTQQTEQVDGTLMLSRFIDTV